jgi:drug/metabolite transporter (DMT)-like permease
MMMADPAASRSSARLPALIAGFAALYLVWGSTYLGIKYAVETLPPFLMAGCRFLLAGAILYAALRLRGTAAPTRHQWGLAALTGALLLLGGNGLVTWGQQTVPSGRAALIVATTPLWMVILGWLFYKGERPRLRVWLGLAVGFAGAALLIRPSADDRAGTLTGTLAIMAAPVTWAIGSLESRRNRPTEDALLTSAMQMLAGGAMMLLTGTLLGEWPVALAREVSTRSVLAFLYLTFIGGLVGFTTYAWLLRVASPTAVSTYAYVNPLVAVLLGWLVAGEALGAEVLLAAALVVGAVVLITLPRSPRVAATETREGPKRRERVRKRTEAVRGGCDPVAAGLGVAGAESSKPR